MLVSGSGTRECGNLCYLSRLRQIQKPGANGLLHARHTLIVLVVEQTREDADRDAFKKNDLEHLTIDRARLQIE